MELKAEKFKIQLLDIQYNYPVSYASANIVSDDLVLEGMTDENGILSFESDEYDLIMGKTIVFKLLDIRFNELITTLQVSNTL